MFAKLSKFVPYFVLIIFLALISLISQNLIGPSESHFLEDTDLQVFILGSILFVGYYINRIAPKTAIPSFVWAIFAGIALQPLLGVFTHNITGLSVVMEVFGAIVLFAGGMEIPFGAFKKWFFIISSLALVGILISAIGFSAVLVLLAQKFGIYTVALVPSLIILGAALSSTDPTAVIPTLKELKLKRNFLKQIAVSEAALTDVSGSVLTNFLLLALVTAESISSSNVLSYFLPLAQKSSYDALALEIISGVIVGYLGFMLLQKFYVSKQKKTEADPALLLAVPIFTFVLGNILAGAGFLAAFVSGLLTDTVGQIKKVSHFYESLLNHLIKPFIFIVLGALVPLSTLMKLAPIGILCALLFMFVIRPLVVFISLSPWLYMKDLKVQDLLFLSFVRETGIIAAVLLVITTTNQIIDSEFVIAIGMWVILLTLLIEPPLTPYVVKRIGLIKSK